MASCWSSQSLEIREGKMYPALEDHRSEKYETLRWEKEMKVSYFLVLVLQEFFFLFLVAPTECGSTRARLNPHTTASSLTCWATEKIPESFRKFKTILFSGVAWIVLMNYLILHKLVTSKLFLFATKCLTKMPAENFRFIFFTKYRDMSFVQ